MSEASEPPLLATKMHAPRRRDEAVPRPRLVQRLSGDAAARLVVITAPPGFGKTTLLTEWLATLGSGRDVAWVSLDHRDDVARTFWRYVVGAVARTTASAEESRAALSRRGASIDAVLTTLINDLDDSADDIVLVLDDFHVIADRSILAGLAFLIENAPPNLQIVISSRADPALPLSRLRASGQLVELRAADLRFDSDEVADYFEHATDVMLPPAAAAMLYERTEGWVAAIQLAAISLRGRTDASEFVASFAGDDRYVVDYLIEEVLRRQPDDLRTFLLETSILGRFTSELVEAVTGITAGDATLETLDRGNLFLIPLDDQRRWYRYHHLFAQMLRARLRSESPERVRTLHLRASAWFEQAEYAEDAIAHALEAGDFDRAATLISAEAPALRRRRDEETLVRWLELLPAALIRERPSLSLELAGAMLSVGRLDGVDELLEAAAEGGAPDEARSIEGGVALYRAAQALTSGEIDSAARYAERAADLAADRNHLARGSANGLIALTRWYRGALGDAEESWKTAVEELRLAGHIADSIGGTIALTDLAVAQGRLSDARALARDALQVALATDPPLKGAADMLVALAGVLRERNDLSGARQRLGEASELGVDNGLPQNAHRLLVATGRVHLADRDFASAIAAFDEAERAYTPDFFPDHHPIAAQRAAACLAAGRHQDAQDWARRRGLSADGDLSFLSEYEHLTWARMLLADRDQPASANRALSLLERMLDAAETGGRTGSAIEIRVLLSLALAKVGRQPDALDVLTQAVRTAETEGYVRVFADEGEPLARLLRLLTRRAPNDSYLRRLVDATTASSPADGASRPALASPLSDRELDVLRLLRSDLGGADIARHLSVSLNTMRTHTKSTYAKLGVTSRRAAVTRATEIGLL